MFQYFYIARVRVRQLTRQLTPEAPMRSVVRASQTRGTKGTSGLASDGLLALAGVKGEASAEIARESTAEIEESFELSDETLVAQLHRFFESSASVIDLNARPAVSSELLRTGTVVRFQGRFQPVVIGRTSAARQQEFARASSLRWEGTVGGRETKLSTSRESFASPTPLLQVLDDENAALSLTGFGTIQSPPINDVVEILPLFMGEPLDV